MTYVESKYKTDIPDYIGHCCIIDENYHKQEIEKNELKLLAGKGNNRDKNDVSIGGCMCFPEFMLLIPTIGECMDGIGLGAEDNLDARWHYVIDEEYAGLIRDEGFHPKLNMHNNWKVQEYSMKIATPHSLKKEKKG